MTVERRLADLDGSLVVTAGQFKRAAMHAVGRGHQRFAKPGHSRHVGVILLHVGDPLRHGGVIVPEQTLERVLHGLNVVGAVAASGHGD